MDRQIKYQNNYQCGISSRRRFLPKNWGTCKTNTEKKFGYTHVYIFINLKKLVVMILFKHSQ